MAMNKTNKTAFKRGALKGPLTAIIAAAGLVAAGLAGTAPAHAGEVEFSGAAGFELRGFLHETPDPNVFDTFQPSITLEPEFRWSTEDRNHRIVVLPFARIDFQDPERTHFDFREAYYRYVGDDYEIQVGLAKVFWGVTESRHLVDVINQSDGVEDIDEEDKLGQPLAKLSLYRNWGQLDAFLLWGFRERTFPGPEGRLRAPLFVDGDDAVYDFELKRGRPGAALRYSNSFGAVDFGLSYFHGPGREPDFVLAPSADRLLPFYKIINQVGIDVQYTQNAWLWKAEGIFREGQGDAFFAGVAGVEYTFYQVWADAWDLGVIAEYLYDGREEFSFTDPNFAAPGALANLQTPAPPTAFENDIFVGGRLALNDTQDTTALLGAIIDADDGTTSMSLEAERRFRENWFVEIEGRFFFNVEDDNQAAIFRDDDFLTLRINRYF